MIKLYQFPLSHYCEKVRWALEYKGLEYERVNLVPGPHFGTVKKLQVKDTTVPILDDSGHLVQNSSDIITYLDEKYPEKLLTPTNTEDAKSALEWEFYLDKQIGVNLRRCGYHILLNERKITLSYITDGSPFLPKLMVNLLFPFLKKRMIKILNINDQTAKHSHEKALEALIKVETELKDKDYLVGSSFSRADLTAASLAALLFWPPKYGFNPKMRSANLEAFSETMRPRAQWVLDYYEKYR